MGVLYLALDPAIDRLVALKLLRVNQAEIRERFLREARLAARLQHPNIVTIFDVGEHEGQPFIAMEYIPGETLAELIARRASLPLDAQAGDDDGGVRRPRLRAQARHRPSRREAGEPDGEPRLAPREDPRLRHRSRRRVDADAGRHADGHAELHVARAGAGRRRRSSERHLRGRRRALRAAGLPPGVPGRESGGAAEQDPRPSRPSR